MELQSDKYDLNTTMNSYNPVHPEQTVSKSNGDKHAWNVKCKQFTANISFPLKSVRRFPDRQAASQAARYQLL